MNEMAMVEYLIKQYAMCKSRIKYTIENSSGYGPDTIRAFWQGEADAIKTVINRFGMKIRETGTEYIAENSVCSVRVKKTEAR